MTWMLTGGAGYIGAHIVRAFRFELSKVTVPAIRERMVGHLRNIDEDLAAKARAETAGLIETLAELKKRSGEVVNKLTANKQAIEAELSETRKEVRTLSEKLGKASGTSDALRAQVAEQQATIRDLSGRHEPGGDGTGTGEKKK